MSGISTTHADVAPARSEDDVVAEIVERLSANPRLLHAVLFKHRHPNATPDFHFQIIDDWWSQTEFVGEMAFREGAKSTLAEEALCGMALLRRFKFGVIVGASYDRAVDRLTAIKHEIETNEDLIEIFGDQRGEKWGADDIILKNGVRIIALGAGQKFRGLKHRDQRPDMCFVDDLEDEDNTATDTQREHLAKWVSRVLWPACRNARKRVAGTPLHPKAWLEQMRKNSGWTFRVHPIVVPAVSDPSQWTHSQWPDRYPLERIKQIRDQYERDGDLQGFVQEYLCQSEEPALKPFQQRHIIKAPHIPEWAPAMIICDPARTANPGKSARSGYIAISWVGAKLYVRHAHGSYDMPSDILNELFRLDEVFQPIHIGVEKDGLEQFLMQPLRLEMARRGRVLPLLPLNAPRDKNKTAFIRGLQPFFEAGDIQLCGDFPELQQEILGFPTGLVDILNCLAYSLKMRGGKPVYEDFSLAHVAPELSPHKHTPLWLVVNTSPTGGSHTAACLIQYLNGAARIFADWVVEGPPEEALNAILPQAVQAANGVAFRYAAPADQFDQFNNFGLGRALHKLTGGKPGQVAHTPHPDRCLGSLTALLRGRALTQAAFLAARPARWTINALSMGYAYGLDKAAVLNPHPDPGYYATLMRGLESFIRWLTVAPSVNEDAGVNWQTTADGRRYISARGGNGEQSRQQLKA